MFINKMLQQCISTMNSAAENIDPDRPLTDILWYAMLDTGVDTPTSILEKSWSESGDRKLNILDLLDDGISPEPTWETEYWHDDDDEVLISIENKRDNVLNALANISTLYPKNIGPMLYFVAETTDAKIDIIKNDIATLFDSVHRLSLRCKSQHNADVYIREWLQAERQYMKNVSTYITEMREKDRTIAELSQRKSWVGILFRKTTIIVSISVCIMVAALRPA
jgi:hypothetical protein